VKPTKKQRREQRERDVLLSRLATDPQQLHATAYHESAHAVTCTLFDFPVEFVTCKPFIKDGEIWQGNCRNRTIAGGDDGQIAILGFIRSEFYLMQIFAGVCTEWKIGTVPFGAIPQSDIRAIDDLLRQMQAIQPELTEQELYARIITKTNAFLDLPPVWKAIEETAKLLLEKKTISGDEVRAIVMEHAAPCVISKKMQFHMLMMLGGQSAEQMPEDFRLAMEKDLAAA
jgi:hypothetical protein